MVIGGPQKKIKLERGDWGKVGGERARYRFDRWRWQVIKNAGGRSTSTHFDGAGRLKKLKGSKKGGVMQIVAQRRNESKDE